VRSLNLSVAVGVVLFEALRQLDLLTLPGSPGSTGL
jgi:tRNA(Leu) C34 or U34 (ribose-2'-O)-methylase TrmL